MNKQQRLNRSGLCVVLFTIGLISCRPDKTLRTFRETQFGLGTLIEITVLDSSEVHATAAMDSAFGEIERIGSLFWEGNPESPLYAFSHRQSESVRIPREVLQLIKRGITISEVTAGAFDMTVGILLPLYDFKSENPQPPSYSEIRERLPYVDYRQLEVDLEGGKLVAHSPQTALATGGIAKGYAVDRAIEVLAAQNIAGAIVNAGGDLRVLPRKDHKRWRIGIQHPRNPDEMLLVLELERGAVTTSGDYQKYFIYEGRRWHHLLDPHNGLPADSCQSVTVMAPTAEMADALATGLFVAGVQKGMEILRQFPDCRALMVRRDGKIFYSDNFPRDSRY